MLIAMCYDMVLRRDVERTVQESPLTLHEEWASWLATEEETRLLCCTYSKSGCLTSRDYCSNSVAQCSNVLIFSFLISP